MIITGLPYAINMLNTIKENGATVNMNDINFPNINKTDIPRVTLIYLRNTNFNVDLDFSKCDYEFKETMLKTWMCGDIIVNIDKLNTTWQKILYTFNGCDCGVLDKSILTVEEIEMFIKNNKSVVENIDIFIKSLSLCAMLRLKCNSSISFDGIKSVDAIFNDNIYNIIEKEFINFILTNGVDIKEPKMFNKYFDVSNEQLFSIIVKETPFATLLYGMTTDKWEEFTNELQRESETYGRYIHE